MGRYRKKMDAFHHETGLLYGVGFTGAFFLIVSALYGAVNIVMACVLFGLMVGLIVKLIIKGEGIMVEIIKGVLGIKKVNMKMQALTDYLKVKFVHVPEHYKCEEIEG